jgi:sugar (pentulose or hexulose) kinase
VDINGHPVACARFMGGREFEQICRQTGSDPHGGFTEADLHQLIEEQVFALPDFSGGSGPFGGRNPECQAGARNGTALASLYCVLMLDYELELLQAKGDIIVEGVWLRNLLQCRLLAQLRPGQPVLLSGDETGTVTGAARLALDVSSSSQELVAVEPTHIHGLDRYRSDWRAKLAV